MIDTLKDTLKPSDLDYVSLSLSPTFERDVWAEANQYSFTAGNNRLILIRDADKLTRWDQLAAWLTRLRTMPGVYLVFVSNEPDLPYTKHGSRKTLKPHAALLKAPRGHLVRCTALNETDALAWVRRRSRLDEATAKYLLTRTGGNLAATAAVCAKLALFEQGAGAATINALTTEQPHADFTDHLIALQKREALLALDTIDDSDRLGTIALLDTRLDLLERLHRIQIAGRTWRETSGINPFLLRQYLPHARHYDTAACVKRRRVLAVVEDVYRQGARTGVFESLVALW